MNHTGRATISSTNPRAQGVCDRCGIVYNLDQLVNQPFFAGTTTQTKNVMVCTNTCLDVPNAQLKAVVLPADPVPVLNPRVYDFVTASSDIRVTQDGAVRITQNDKERTSQQTGEPPGGLDQTPGTNPPGGPIGPVGIPYDFDEIPQTGPLT